LLRPGIKGLGFSWVRKRSCLIEMHQSGSMAIRSARANDFNILAKPSETVLYNLKPIQALLKIAVSLVRFRLWAPFFP